MSTSRPILIAVAPDKFAPGLAPGCPNPPPAYQVVELKEALRAIYETDAHFVPYHNGAARQARINKTGLPLYAGGDLVVDALIAEEDLPGHGEWTPELRATAREQEATLEILSTVGIYETAHGRRFVQPLAEPIPLADVERHLHRWLEHLRAAGVNVDMACKDWTRHYRLPHVQRDGKPYRSPYVNLDRMQPIALAPLPPVEPRPPRPAMPPTISSTADRYARAALESAAAKVSSATEGMRNAALFAEAVALYELVGGGVLAESDVVATMTHAALAAGLSEREIGPTLRQARRGLDQPRRPAERPAAPVAAPRETMVVDEEPMPVGMPPPHVEDAPAPLAQVEQALQGISEESPESTKRPAIKKALEILASTSDELDREQAYRYVANRVGLGVQLLKRAGKAQKRRTPPPTNGKPIIEIRAGELHLQRERALEVLAADPAVFIRDRELVEVISADGEKRSGLHIPRGVKVIAAMAKPRLRAHLSELVSFVRWSEQRSEHVACDPPSDLVEAVFADGEFPGLRRLEGISTAPILRPDGTIVSSTGYDAQTRTVIALDGTVEIPAGLTLKDARAALVELREVYEDFPFRAERDRSVALAVPLTLLGRAAIDGPVPAFIFMAHTRGTGKTLAAEVGGIIGTGEEAPAFPFTFKDEEWAKKITAGAREGLRFALVDNVPSGGEVGSPALANAITRRIWADRVLGESRTVSHPLRMVFVFTGNNLSVRDDLDRRVLLCHLDASVERPEERTGFKRDPLMPWVRSERPRLLRAALIILSAYCRAGRPDQKLPRFGSFEGWSDLVRSALVWVGEPDPVEGLAAKDPEADPARQVHVAAMLAWNSLEERSGCTGLSVKEALELVETHKLGEEAEALTAFAGVRDPKRPALDARALGDRLRAVAGAPRSVDGSTIAFVKADRKLRSAVATWTVSGLHGQHGQHGQLEVLVRENKNLGQGEEIHARTWEPSDDRADRADRADGGRWGVQ